MRPVHTFALLLLVACESMPSSGRVFQPVAATKATPAAAPTPEPGAEEPLVPGEAPEPVPAAGDTDPMSLQARLAGVDAGAVREAPKPAPAPAAAAPPLQVPIPVQVPVWDPGRPPEASSWGLRLLSTLSVTSPARAILVMPDGSESVVKAGDMLPAHGVVVWAIGRDRVELAHVSADGPFARVETRALQALVPSAPVQ